MEWRKRLLLILIGFAMVFPWNLGRDMPLSPNGGRAPASLDLPSGQALCREAATSEPPFLVSASSQPGLNYADFQAQARASAVVGYLPRASIVRLQPGASLPNPKSLKSRVFVPVEVVSTPSSNLDQTGRKSRQPLRNAIVGKGARAEPGAQGYVAYDALKPVHAYTFIVKEDAPLARIPGAGPYLAGRALRLAMTPVGQFRVRKCCSAANQCQIHYLFEVLSPDLSDVESEIPFDQNACVSLLDGIRPVENDQIAPVLSFLNMTQASMDRGASKLEMIDAWGFVKLPSDPVTGEGPFGSYHYEPDGGPAVAYDSFADATSACAFLKILESHQQSCRSPGCEIQWGDAFSDESWGVHASHDSGQCIDIHPMKRVDSRDPLKWNFDPKRRYDPVKTQELVNLLLRAGADPDQLFFNDPRIRGVKYHVAHDNHLHACFKSDSPEVARTCTEGIPSGRRVPAGK